MDGFLAGVQLCLSGSALAARTLFLKPTGWYLLAMATKPFGSKLYKIAAVNLHWFIIIEETAAQSRQGSQVFIDKQQDAKQLLQRMNIKAKSATMKHALPGSPLNPGEHMQDGSPATVSGHSIHIADGCCPHIGTENTSDTSTNYHSKHSWST